jgi:hypothetical protein
LRVAKRYRSVQPWRIGDRAKASHLDPGAVGFLFRGIQRRFEVSAAKEVQHVGWIERGDL